MTCPDCQWYRAMLRAMVGAGVDTHAIGERFADLTRTAIDGMDERGPKTLRPPSMHERQTHPDLPAADDGINIEEANQ